MEVMLRRLSSWQTPAQAHVWTVSSGSERWRHRLRGTKMFSRHARKHFSQAEGSQLDEVRQVMGMLAFPPDTHISPYKVTAPRGPGGCEGAVCGHVPMQRVTTCVPVMLVSSEITGVLGGGAWRHGPSACISEDPEARARQTWPGRFSAFPSRGSFCRGLSLPFARVTWHIPPTCSVPPTIVGL